MNRTVPHTLSFATTLTLFISTVTGFGSAPVSAHPATTAPPATVALHQAVQHETGIPLTLNTEGTTHSTLFPALDFTYLHRLKLTDLHRTDDTGRTIPWGANNWDCTPSPHHPLPVVLVHGFNTTMGANWIAISPLLAAAGYCVYALNWGIVPTLDNAGHAPLRTGAEQVRNFIDQVLATTGAPQVDLIGHSAGGVMPRWYLNKMGGHRYVRNFFALAPATNGTDVFGMTTAFPTLTQNIVNKKSKDQPAVVDLIAGSDFIREVNTPSPIHPDVTYTIVSTLYDEMVTPVSHQFLPTEINVSNYLLQKICPLSVATHGNMAEHPVVFQLVENVLGNNHYPIRCI